MFVENDLDIILNLHNIVLVKLILSKVFHVHTIMKLIGTLLGGFYKRIVEHWYEVSKQPFLNKNLSYNNVFSGNLLLTIDSKQMKLLQ